MTTTAVVRYRKTGKGDWVAFGPVDVVRAGQTVTVTKKDGSTKVEHVDKVGRPFRVDGVDMVYGYLAAAQKSAGFSEERCYRGHRDPVAGCHDCFDLWDM